MSRMALLLCVAIAAPARAAGSPPTRCQNGASGALATCIQRVATKVRTCYLDTGSACPSGERHIASALARLQTAILAKCRKGQRELSQEDEPPAR